MLGSCWAGEMFETCLTLDEAEGNELNEEAEKGGKDE